MLYCAQKKVEKVKKEDREQSLHLLLSTLGIWGLTYPVTSAPPGPAGRDKVATYSGQTWETTLASIRSTLRDLRKRVSVRRENRPAIAELRPALVHIETACKPLSARFRN